MVSAWDVNWGDGSADTTFQVTAGAQTTFQFTPTNPNAPLTDYAAVVKTADGNTAILTSAGVPQATGVTGRIVANFGGYDVEVNDPNAAGNATFSVNVYGSNGFAVQGTILNNGTLHFTGNAANPSASDYLAVVNLGGGNSVALNSQGVIQSTGATGQIVADPNGGDDVQLAYGQARSDESYTIQVYGTDNTEVTGSTINQIEFPFAGSASSLSNYTAVVNLQDGNSVVLNSGGVVTAPTGANGNIAYNNNNGGYDLTFTDPGATLGQSVGVQVANANGSIASGSVVNADQFHSTGATQHGHQPVCRRGRSGQRGAARRQQQRHTRAGRPVPAVNRERRQRLRCPSV